MLIGIALVTFNGEAYLEACLQSIREQTYGEWQLSVWDNASTDGTRSILEGTHDDLTCSVEFSDRNLGFAEGANRACTVLSARGCSHVLFLNQDVRLTPNVLERMADYAAAHPTDIMQPAILLEDGKTVNTLGNTLHYLGLSFCDGFGDIYKECPVRSISSASGACMMVPQSVLASIGPLDGGFFTYMEDTDLCLRASLAGYRIALIGDAVVLHSYEFRMLASKIGLLETNRWRMLIKCYPLSLLVLCIPGLLFLEGQILLYSLLRGAVLQKVQAYIRVLLQLPTLLAQRSRVQKHRTIQVAELLAIVKPEVGFGPMNNWAVRHVANPLYRLHYAMLSLVFRREGPRA